MMYLPTSSGAATTGASFRASSGCCDIDYEMYPDRHCVTWQEILREHGVDRQIIRAVAEPRLEAF